MVTKLNPVSPVLRKDLDGAIDAILAGMDNMFQDQNKQLKKRFELIDERFESIDEQLAELKTEQRYIKDEIKNQKAEFSTVPSRENFNQLEAKVNRYHPVN